MLNSKHGTPPLYSARGTQRFWLHTAESARAQRRAPCQRHISVVVPPFIGQKTAFRTAIRTLVSTRTQMRMWRTRNGTPGVCVRGGAVVQLGSPVSSNTSRSRCTRMRLVILSMPPDTVILNDDMHMVTLEPTLCRIHSHIRTHIITTIATAASRARARHRPSARTRSCPCAVYIHHHTRSTMQCRSHPSHQLHHTSIPLPCVRVPTPRT